MNRPLSAYQWGFLESRSTVTALLYCTNEWFKALEDGKEVCGILWLEKRVRLRFSCSTPKLDAIGLDKHITKWLHNYLANRTKAIVINGFESRTAPLLSGVPQCSVLGPLLFLIIEAISSKVSLFANDILLYHFITNTHDYIILQEVITLLGQWSTANHWHSINRNASIWSKHTPTLPPTQWSFGESRKLRVPWSPSDQ